MGIFDWLFGRKRGEEVRLPASETTAGNMVLCPYCGYDVKIPPKRKKKCPSCSQPIYIKATPDNRTKRLMTQKQADATEEQWNLIGERQSSIATISLIGCDESDIERERARGAKSDREAVRSIATRVSASSKDLNVLRMTFRVLAKCAAEDGKPFRHFMEEAHRCDLRGYKISNVIKKVEIFTSENKNVCIACQSKKGLIYDIDEALKTMPLPCSECTCIGYGEQKGNCGCYYLPVVP